MINLNKHRIDFGKGDVGIGVIGNTTDSAQLAFYNQRRWTSAICIWKQMDMWETCIKELHEKWLPAHWRKDSHSL